MDDAIKNIELIPIGSYCYGIDSDAKKKHGEITTVYCPYYTYKTIAGVNVVHCSFLNESGLGNMSDEDYNKLEKHFGSEDEMDKHLNDDLLWDSCKSCGENHEEDMHIDLSTTQGIERLQIKRKEWLRRVKSLNKIK